MRIDAHQHYWSIARRDYGWLTPELAPIYRDFMPEDLAPHLAAAGISRTILVQAAPTEAETAFLLALAQETPSVAGVVGWTDFDAPEAPERITAMAAEPMLVGLRPMIHDIADPDWMLSPAVSRALEAMTRQGLVFDALVRPQHLRSLRHVAEHHPALTIVIDHAAKPLIATGAITDWTGDMRALARLPHVVVKLSGMVTEAAKGWRVEDLVPYVAVLGEAFGPSRMLWGSDWPVLNLASDYPGWVAATARLLAAFSAPEQGAILGETARRVYGAKRGRF